MKLMLNVVNNLRQSSWTNYLWLWYHEKRKNGEFKLEVEVLVWGTEEVPLLLSSLKVSK